MNLRATALFFWLATAVSGISVYRRAGVPYENGRYFDPATGVVLKSQSLISLEAFTGVLLVLSLYLTVRWWNRRQQEV